MENEEKEALKKAEVVKTEAALANLESDDKHNEFDETLLDTLFSHFEKKESPKP